MSMLWVPSECPYARLAYHLHDCPPYAWLCLKDWKCSGSLINTHWKNESVKMSWKWQKQRSKRNRDFKYQGMLATPKDSWKWMLLLPKWTGWSSKQTAQAMLLGTIWQRWLLTLGLLPSGHKHDSQTWMLFAFGFPKTSLGRLRPLNSGSSLESTAILLSIRHPYLDIL